MKIIYQNTFPGELGSEFQVRLIDTAIADDGHPPALLYLFDPGFTLNYMATGVDELNTPVIGSELTVHIKVDRSQVRDMLQTLAGNDDYRYVIEITKNGSRFWIGYVEYSGQSFEDLYFPYAFDIKAVDGLGRLADVPFLYAEIMNTAVGQRRSFSNIIFDCLQRMELQPFYNDQAIFVKFIHSWIAVATGVGDIPLGPLDSTFDKARIDPFVLQNIDGNYQSKTCLEVLEMIFYTFNLRIFQSNGMYVIEQINEKLRPQYKAYHYNHSGTIFEVLADQKYIDGEFTKLTGSTYQFIPSVREASVNYNFFDIDLNLFPPPNPAFQYPQNTIFEMTLPIQQGDSFYFFNKTYLAYSGAQVPTSHPRYPLYMMFAAYITIESGSNIRYFEKINNVTGAWVNSWSYFPTQVHFQQFPFYSRGDNSSVDEMIEVAFNIPPATISGTMKVRYEILFFNTEINSFYTPHANAAIGNRSTSFVMKLANQLSGLVRRHYSVYNRQPGAFPEAPIKSSHTLQLPDTSIGDGPLTISSGAIFDDQNRIIRSWRMYSAPQALGNLLLVEILIIRKKAIYNLNAEIQSDSWHPLYQVSNEGLVYTFMNGSFTGSNEIWSLNLFEHQLHRGDLWYMPIQNITDDSAGDSTPGTGSGSPGTGGTSTQYFAGDGIELVNNNTFRASSTLRKIAEANNLPTWNGNTWPGAFPEAPNDDEVYLRGSLSWIAGITKSVFDTLKNAFDTHVLSKVHVPDPTGQPDGKILETQNDQLVYVDKPGRNIDGGRASSVYLPSQKISGGNA
jgi:hypothetical protein